MKINVDNGVKASLVSAAVALLGFAAAVVWGASQISSSVDDLDSTVKEIRVEQRLQKTSISELRIRTSVLRNDVENLERYLPAPEGDDNGS